VTDRPPARNRDFPLYWAGQTLSALGDAFAAVAVPLLVLEATGSLARMGLITALFGVGSLLAGVVAGPLVDRADRRRLMIRCDLGRALVYAAVPVGWWLAGPQPWLLAAVTVAGAALGMVFGVAAVAAVPNLVERDRITEANGRLEASYAVAFVAGPALAGLVSARFGPAAAIGFDALTFLVSAGSLALVRLRAAPAVSPGSATAGGRVRELSVGVRFLAGEPLFRWLTVLVGAAAFASFGVTDLFVAFLRTDLGQGDRAVGLVFGLAGLGAVAGGLLTPGVRRRWGFGVCFVGGLALVGAALLLAAVAPSLAAVAAVAVCYTFGQTAHLQQRRLGAWARRDAAIAALRSQLLRPRHGGAPPFASFRAWWPAVGPRRGTRTDRARTGLVPPNLFRRGRVRYHARREPSGSPRKDRFRRRWHARCNRAKRWNGPSAASPRCGRRGGAAQKGRDQNRGDGSLLRQVPREAGDQGRQGRDDEERAQRRRRHLPRLRHQALPHGRQQGQVVAPPSRSPEHERGGAVQAPPRCMLSPGRAAYPVRGGRVDS
jgi:MFS family permease